MSLPSADHKETPTSQPTSVKPVDTGGPAKLGLSVVMLFRRALLAGATALIVARPLVAGEDPGLLRPWSGPGGVVLLFGWLLLGVGWAITLLIARPKTWKSGFLEASFLGLVVLLFFSAQQASYKHAAWLVAWEWLGMFVAFFLVRQLQVTSAELRGLLAVLLATGVAVSAQVTCQSLTGHKAPAATGSLHALPTETEWHSGAVSYSEQPYCSPFEDPASLACFLGMLVPIALGGAALCRGGPIWRSALASVLVLALGIGMAWSFGYFPSTLIPLFALAITGLLLFVWQRNRAQIPKRSKSQPQAPSALVRPQFSRTWVLTGIAVMAAGLVLLGMKIPLRSMAEERWDAWTASARMMEAHGWLGVGPGNFDRYVDRYLPPHHLYDLTQPLNSYVELAATGGWLALGALLLVLGLFIRAAYGSWQSQDPEPDVYSDPSRTPWEFYLGGMAGLLLGFLLQAHGKSGHDILHDAAMAGIRSVVWFAAFAFVDSISWPRIAIARLAGWGALTAIGSWTMLGGTSLPSVALPYWVLAALCLNALPKRLARESTLPWFGPVLALPLLIALAVAGYLTVVYPVLASATATHRALLAGRLFLEDEKKPAEQREIKSAKDVLQRRVLKNLVEAVRLDGGNLGENENADEANQDRGSMRSDFGDARLHLYLAYWYGRLWQLEPYNGEWSRDATWHAARVRQVLDPEGRDGSLAEYRLRILFAKKAKQSNVPNQAKDQYKLAAERLREVIQKEPYDPRLYYLLAEALIESDQVEDGRTAAREALNQDRDGLPSDRRLTEHQIDQLRAWIKKK
ncbi:MAG: tetratricopeptide repeat protein [Gemmataceae bacterium]